MGMATGDKSDDSSYGCRKYNRPIRPSTGGEKPIVVDVYAVLVAFSVTCPARQHAIKKLLCAGLRGKADEVTDLKEAEVALRRAIQMAESVP